jgi:hypothetical protein
MIISDLASQSSPPAGGSVFYFTFFCTPKESSKEKAPEMISLPFRYARYTCLYPLRSMPKLAAPSSQNIALY